jgi:virulence factor
MVRLGMVDFDSSHSIEFTRRLNGKGIAEEQWVAGARVVVGCRLPSAISEESLIEQYTSAFTGEQGLPLVSRPEEMIGQVDGVLICSQDGSVHLERARPFLEAGLPVYVDKPFTCSVADARALIDLARAKNVPLFSSSSLRYAPELTAFLARREETGRPLGCDAYSPAATHPRNPGLYHYGIHGVEMLYTVMGQGCQRVWTIPEPGGEVAVGVWADGRLGTMRGIREGAAGLGCTIFCEKKIEPITAGTRYIYRELLKEVVAMFETGKAPLDIEETLELTAFMEAALRSGENGGSPQPLATAA